jgi:hypothetical protein
VPYVFFPGVSKWKLQGEWSNVAYTAGTGYPNAQGQTTAWMVTGTAADFRSAWGRTCVRPVAMGVRYRGR